MRGRRSPVSRRRDPGGPSVGGSYIFMLFLFHGIKSNFSLLKARVDFHKFHNRVTVQYYPMEHLVPSESSVSFHLIWNNNFHFTQA